MCLLRGQSSLSLSLFPLLDVGMAKSAQLTQPSEGSRLVRDVKCFKGTQGPDGDWDHLSPCPQGQQPWSCGRRSEASWIGRWCASSMNGKGKSLGPLRFPKEERGEEAEGGRAAGVPSGVAVFGACTADGFPS